MAPTAAPMMIPMSLDDDDGAAALAFSLLRQEREFAAFFCRSAVFNCERTSRWVCERESGGRKELANQLKESEGGRESKKSESVRRGLRKRGGSVDFFFSTRLSLHNSLSSPSPSRASSSPAHSIPLFLRCQPYGELMPSPLLLQLASHRQRATLKTQTTPMPPKS